jgi:hypothetical protein
LYFDSKTANISGVGYIWTRVPSSPPVERRDEVRQICARHKGRLVEDQIYYGADGGNAYALIELPAEADKHNALIADLKAHEWLGLVHADDYAGGTQPPPPHSGP